MPARSSPEPRACPADTNLLRQVAGTQSAMAIFDIGKLQFLYITRLPSANSMQSALWQTRSKFETRNAGGVDFFSRRDAESEREVAFAVTGDYLILATREDLVAGALQLMKTVAATMRSNRNLGGRSPCLPRKKPGIFEWC